MSAPPISCTNRRLEIVYRRKIVSVGSRDSSAATMCIRESVVRPIVVATTRS